MGGNSGENHINQHELLDRREDWVGGGGGGLGLQSTTSNGPFVPLNL